MRHSTKDNPTYARGWIHFVDFTDLEDPQEVARYEVPEAGTHNLWVEGDTLYLLGGSRCHSDPAGRNHRSLDTVWIFDLRRAVEGGLISALHTRRAAVGRGLERGGSAGARGSGGAAASEGVAELG